MARRRISAMFMHNKDLVAVEGVLNNPEVSGRVVVGDVDEEQIDLLRDAGLFVQQITSSSESEAVSSDEPPRLASSPARPRLRAAARAQLAAEPQLPAVEDVYVLRVAGSLLPNWMRALADNGGELLQRVGEASYTIRLGIGEVGAVRRLGFVLDLRLYTAADTLHEDQLAEAGPIPIAPALPTGILESDVTDEAVEFDLVLHTPAGAEEVLAWLRAHDVEIEGAAGRKIRVRLARGARELSELARRPEVATIDEWVPPTLSNDRARAILGIETPAGGSPDDLPPRAWSIPWTGRGQRVAVADSGIDEDHPGLAGRLAAVIAYGIPDDASDHHGHGTHVAGSIAGADGPYQGVAPEAELVIQAVMDAGGGLSGLPLDLATLFEDARQQGAFIHNNSWGALAASAYRSSSLEVDAYVHEHPDVLVVIAAGNNGTASAPRNAQPGFVDLFSVDAPATAKNALTVGASRSDRTREPALTWAEFDQRRFADSPIGEQLVSGDATAVAAFSGRGPCQEQTRMKPDVVAPGTFILSARSAKAPAENFWAIEDDHYAFMGGTSMAAPLVSGCAALVRQYYLEDRGHTPSAALLKATLVNGTRWLTGADAIADHPGEPNYHQGFGRVDLPSTIPGHGLERLEFSDGWQSPQLALGFTGDSRTFVFTTAGGPLRMCLTWTDLPGPGLQNSLALLVEHTTTGQRWSGNPRRKKVFEGGDPGNNVQVIRWDDAPAGPYSVQVTAINLLPRSAGAAMPPQAFALVTTGDLTQTLDLI
jgi:serine protease AprX